MKNKNGFTLIELLAVIVILAIIAVIATPIIVGLIEDARKSAAADSAYGATEAVKTFYSTSMLTSTDITLPITVTWANGSVNAITYGASDTAVTDTSKFAMSGTQPTSGSVTLNDDGTYTLTSLVVNSYNCAYKENSTTTIECTK